MQMCRLPDQISNYQRPSHSQTRKGETRSERQNVPARLDCARPGTEGSENQESVQGVAAIYSRAWSHNQTHAPAALDIMKWPGNLVRGKLGSAELVVLADALCVSKLAHRDP